MEPSIGPGGRIIARVIQHQAFWEALSGQSSRSGGRTSHALRRRRQTRRKRTAERLGIFLPPEPKDLVPLPLPDNRMTKPRQPETMLRAERPDFFIARPLCIFPQPALPNRETGLPPGVRGASDDAPFGAVHSYIALDRLTRTK
jgi:hypothetical protein